MLDKFILFVSKQPVLIEISDIHQVVFSRVDAGIATARTFDMQIITKHGPEYTFISINKEDLRVAAAGGDSDKEMQSVASYDDEEQRVRRAGDDDDDSEAGK